MIKNIAENVKISKLYAGAADSVVCDTVDMAQWQHSAFVVTHFGAADTDLTLSLYEATDVAAGTNAAVTVACPLYADTDMGTSSDTLVAQTAAYEFTIDTTTQKNQMWVIEVDPAILSAGYGCCYLADSGGHADNTVVIQFVGIPRYSSSSLPSAIS